MDNIKLDYKLTVTDTRTNDQYLSPGGAEVFVDEHDRQWVKFVPTNGYDAGYEHNIRTDYVKLVRRDAITQFKRHANVTG